jgi:hypothetical protein
MPLIDNFQNHRMREKPPSAIKEGQQRISITNDDEVVSA